MGPIPSPLGVNGSDGWYQMLAHLIALSLYIVIVRRKVKITIES